MARAKSLFHSANRAINYCARSIAQSAVKEQLRDQGVRVTLVPVHEIEEKAREYLANHPELYVQARERAVRMGWIEEPQGVLVTPDWWGKRRPVTQTGSAKSGTEKTQLFSTTSAIFRRSCLLIAG